MSRKSCMSVLASVGVVRRPSTKTPIAAEMMAATAGPLGRSWMSSSWACQTISSLVSPPSRTTLMFAIMMTSRLLDGCRFGDECAEEPRRGRGRERQHPDGDGRVAEVLVHYQLLAVVQDDERHGRRQYG